MQTAHHHGYFLDPLLDPAVPSMDEAAAIVFSFSFAASSPRAPRLTAENRMLTTRDVAAQSRLAPEIVHALALYDVLEPADDAYGYRDLLAAREVGLPRPHASKVGALPLKGEYPALSIAAAPDVAKDQKRDVDTGRDPLEAGRALG